MSKKKSTGEKKFSEKKRKKESIPLQLVRIDNGGCHMLIKVKINSAKAGVMIVDTGASQTVFDLNTVKPLAEPANAKPDGFQSTGINEGYIDNDFGTIKKFKIGKCVVSDMEIVMLDLSHIRNIYKNYCKQEIYGLLGGDFLLRHRASLCYKKKTLSIY